MRKQGIMLGLALLIGGWIIHSPASAQEYRGTAQQQMACTPDVWRLCSDQIPNVGQIVACLQQNTPRLSPGCRAALETGGPNNRVARSRPYAPPQYVPPPYAPPPYAMRPGVPPAPYYGGPPPPYYDYDY
jgi:hypothetical protein